MAQDILVDSARTIFLCILYAQIVSLLGLTAGEAQPAVLVLEGNNTTVPSFTSENACDTGWETLTVLDVNYRAALGAVAEAMSPWTHQVILFILLPGAAKVADAQITSPRMISPAVACADFSADDPTGSSWSLSDCEGVWNHWISQVPGNQHTRYLDRRIFQQQPGERTDQEGTRCFAGLPPVGDGIGSSSIRSIATWIFAEEIGCEWVAPQFGSKAKMDANGRTKYCHSVVTLEERENMTVQEHHDHGEKCIYVNWVRFFGFDRHSVPTPTEGVIKTVVLDPGKLGFTERQETLRSEIESAKSEGMGRVPWDSLFVTFIDNNGSSRYFLSINNWDARKREITRGIVQKLRQSFYDTKVQRMFNGPEECAFDETRLNFGIHIRMGDRRQYINTDTEYFRLLDAFMDTVTARVLNMGLPEPLFHVFTETSSLCPPRDTGVFEEFFAWPPVVESQVEACWNAKPPEDCPEKTRGLAKKCWIRRSGVFRLQGRRVVLHIDPNVVKTMSCMAHTDGLLMGCSTFGQVAGILTEGISFFSMACSGERTPNQYKLVPPIALAERGKMWVPIEGSWRDPVLWSEDALVGALRELVGKKKVAANLTHHA